MAATVLIFCAVVAVAAWVQGTAGFGSSMVAAPVVVALVDRHTSVASLLLVGLVINVVVLVRLRGTASRRPVLWLLTGAVVGLPAGLWVLNTVPAGSLRIGVGLVAIAMAVLALSFRGRRSPAAAVMIGAGVVSGILQASTTISGPPVVALLAGSEMPRDVVRRTLAMYFLVLTVIALGLLLTAGDVSPESALLGGLGAPVVLAATLAGDVTARRLGDRSYSTLALALVIVSGIVAIWTGLGI